MRNTFLKLFFLIGSVMLSSFFCRSQTATLPDSIQKKLSGKNDTAKISLLLNYARQQNSGNYSLSLLLAENAKELAQKNNQQTAIAEALKIIGLDNYFQGNHDKALENYLQSLKIFESINNKDGIVRMENEIGNLYRKNGDASSAIKHLKKALEVSKADHNLDGIANTYNNIGVAYETKNDYDKALTFYRDALRTYSELGSKLGCSYSQSNIAGVFWFHQQFDSSFIYLEKSLKIREELNDQTAIAVSLNDIGEMFMAKHDSLKAIEYFQKSLKLSQQIGFKDLQQHTAKFLSECYFALKDYAKAYQFHKLYSSLKDSVFNEQKNKQITEMQTKYETEKKDLEISKSKLVIEEQKTQRNILIISIIILIAISYFVYSRYRFKQRIAFNEAMLKQQELRSKAIIDAEENERKRIARELHDGLGQQLSAVKLNMSSLDSSLELKTDEQRKMLQNALDIIDDSVKEVRAVSHSMMPNVLVKSGLTAAVSEFANRITSANKIKIEIEAHGLTERLDGTTETILFRVLQEIVNNIIKHSEASQVNIQIIRHEDEVMLMVEDNGKGFEIAKISGEGIGIKNIQSRIEFLNGKVNFDSQPQKGTTVIIEVPIQ